MKNPSVMRTAEIAAAICEFNRDFVRAHER